MRRKIVFLLLFLWLLPTNIIAKSGKEIVTFSACVDGDTAYFNVDGVKTKVRFIAINTPEISGTAEAYGEEAATYTCNKIKQATKIELEYDPKCTEQDKYGRTLAWIWVDDALLEANLVDEGLAEVKYIYGDYLYVDELEAKETIAKSNKLGMWSDETTSDHYSIEDIAYLLLLVIVYFLFYLYKKNKKKKR